MAKYIAHASIDERGKIAGGKAGDSTKKEVCIRTWYNKPWNYLLRIKDENVRIQFANNMIDLANNNNIGYDQNQRNTLLTQAKKVNFDFSKIATKCECDCSSAVTACILGAIYKEKGKDAYNKAYEVMFAGSNCATTSTLRTRLKKLEMITVYSDKSYVGSIVKALFGDIYVKEGSHVVAYINDGKKVEINKVSYYKKYTGESYGIDTVFAAIGVPEIYRGNYKNRRPVAKANGLGSNYTGSANDNLKLISLAKQGKLKKP